MKTDRENALALPAASGGRQGDPAAPSSSRTDTQTSLTLALDQRKSPTLMDFRQRKSLSTSK